MTRPPWRDDLPLSSINQNNETLLDLGDCILQLVLLFFYKNSLSHLDGWMDEAIYLYPFIRQEI